MSKRVEALTKLKEYVEQERNTIGYYVYSKDDEEICYCAIGFLAREYGVQDSKMKIVNTKPIGFVSFKEVEEMVDTLSLDFSHKELGEIQHLNDRGVRGMLLEYIEELIQKS